MFLLSSVVPHNLTALCKTPGGERTGARLAGVLIAKAGIAMVTDGTDLAVEAARVVLAILRQQQRHRHGRVCHRHRIHNVCMWYRNLKR